MKTIKIGEKEYQMEFTFEAAECKGLVQSMFELQSGAYFAKKGLVSGDNKEATALAMIDGASEMVADVPRICRIAFYAGLLEHNPVSEGEAKELMKQYMKENKLSFNKLFEDLKQFMEDDGFFNLSGLTDMIQKMNAAAEEKVDEIQKSKTEEKSTSTK